MKKAIELGHQATALDREGKYQEALDVYTLSIEHFMLVWKYEQNPSFKQRLETKIDEYMRRAEQIKQHVNKQVYRYKTVVNTCATSNLLLVRLQNRKVAKPLRIRTGNQVLTPKTTSFDRLWKAPF